MDLSELKGLPHSEAIAKAAAFAGVRPEVLDGVWKTESGRGTHPTMIGPTTKWGTAKGHFQQLDGIVETWSKRTGKKLDPFDFHDGLYMAALQFRENMKRYGDEATAVMAYHGGTNPRNWGAKTKDYVQKVLGMKDAPVPRAGKKANTEIAPAKAALPSSWAAQLAEIRPAAPEAQPETAAPQPAVELGPTLGPSSPVLGRAPVAGAMAAASERIAVGQVPADVPFTERVSTAYAGQQQPFFNFIAKMTGDLDREEVDPAFIEEYQRDLLKMEEGFEQHEREYLRESTSRAGFEARKAELLERRQRERTIYGPGLVSGIGAELVAGLGDPAGWAIGLGAGKLLQLGGIGSQALARAGRPGAALGSLAAENVAGNVAYELALDSLGEYRSPMDYAIAAGVGLGMGGAFSLPTYREATRRALELDALKEVDKLVTDKLQNLREAFEELGPDATPAQVAQAAARVEAEAYKQHSEAAIAEAPESDRIPAAELVVEEELELDARSSTTAGTDEPTPAEVIEMSRTERSYAPFEDPAYQQRRIDAAATNEQWQAALRGTLDREVDYQSLKAGEVFVSNRAYNNPELRPAIELIETLAPLYLGPNAKVGVGTGVGMDGAHGVIRSFGDTHLIALDPKLPKYAAIHTALHELGHAVFHHNAPTVQPELLARVNAEWRDFVKAVANKDPDAVGRRFAATSDSRFLAERVPRTQYGVSRDEWLAENFVKYIQQRAEEGALGGKIPNSLIQQIVRAFNMVLDLIRRAKKDNHLQAPDSVKEMFDWILENAHANRKVEEEFLAPDLRLPDLDAASKPVVEKGRAKKTAGRLKLSGEDQQLVNKYGLDLMPQSTPVERAEFKAVIDIYRKAEAWVKANPRVDEKVRTLLNKSETFQVTGTALAASDNPVARMVAGVLLESTTGAQGRRRTAAIAHWMHERRFVGNSLRDYSAAYEQWAKLQGAGTGKRIVNDLIGGKLRERFNRAVSMEIEARGRGTRVQSDPTVVRAADALEAAYERMRLAQQDSKSVGFTMLPDTSRGYMPHVLARNRVINMTQAEQRIFVEILTEQFQQIEGFDAKFSAELARKYLDHARINANGGHEVPANIHQPGAANMVRDALKDMKLSRDQIEQLMKRYSRGGASFTKARLRLDLTKEYSDGQGGKLRLLDLFSTDHTELLRRYARRAAGEVALAQFGVMGSQGLRLLRRAMEFGPDADNPRLREHFDQVASEFLGIPFGDNNSVWMDRAMQMNSLARLGGMGFTQLGEFANAVTHLGARHTLAAIKDMPRLRRELLAIARGEQVDNPILKSIELWGGAGEFGAEGYRMVMPFDNPDAAYHGYGQDTITSVDRMLRAGTHAQAIASFWRSISAVQHRGMAEQITLKAIRFIRDGGEDGALADMGFTPAMVKKLREDLPNMVKYDDHGRVAEFDLSKASDPAVAAEFAQAVVRGTHQIIQGTFIGETGKWAHNGMLKLLTQFRTFPIVAMEKQWARQRANRGLAAALGMLIGSMAVVTPVIMARIAWSAVGRPDAEEYLEERLTPANIARMSLNYVAMAGLAGDLFDAVSAVTGIGDEVGARAGGARGAVGNLFAPALGYVDDVYRTMQNPDDPHRWAQLLPGSRLPQLVPIINMLRED